MHPGALLDLTSELQRAVLHLDQPADGVVSQFFRKHRALGARERHTVAETTYALLRRRPLFEHLAQQELASLAGHAPATAAGAGADPHALSRRLAMLAWQGDAAFLLSALNPHEQAWLAKVQGIDVSALPPKLHHNLPDWLAAPLQEQLAVEFEPLAQALLQTAPLDLRVNALKAKRDEVLAALAQEGITAEPTPYSPLGLRVAGKPALNRSKAFTSGLFEVQDEGSQLLALLVDAKRGEMVVDFCAGSGGKTLALGAAMRNTGRLYAFDTSGHRLDSIKPRLTRSGLANVHPAQIAHESDERVKRLFGKIDRVLVDAPCSGLGTLRRNPDLKWRQSPQAIQDMALKQQAILASAARLLKPGGRLVYATCSLLSAENEAVAEAFNAAVGHSFKALPAKELLTSAKVTQTETLCMGPYLRLWPHRHATDGFFAAAWSKT
jgi:16S rRNA (cytosine967-C5)-methyltransferase